MLERLEHGSLDFAIFIEPIDPMQYEYISLPDSSRWGLLMPSDCALSQKRCVERQELLSVPLILHRRAGLQRLITRWANAELQSLHIAATYNVVNGSPERIARRPDTANGKPMSPLAQIAIAPTAPKDCSRNV